MDFMLVLFFVFRSSQKSIQLCGTEVQGHKVHKLKKFLRGKGKKGWREKTEVNSMIWPTNGLNWTRFLVNRSKLVGLDQWLHQTSKIGGVEVVKVMLEVERMKEIRGDAGKIGSAAWLS